MMKEAVDELQFVKMTRTREKKCDPQSSIIHEKIMPRRDSNLRHHD
jgi:hypothetical protein